MSSVSSAPRTSFLAAVAGAALFAWAVYRLQNSLFTMGGAISIEKTLWLTTALFAWFVLPALVGSDMRLSSSVRRGYLVFLTFMFARGVIELWMMYVAHNWLPLYGIGHDLAAMALLAWLFLAHRDHARSAPVFERAAVANWLALALLFIPEMCFAGYMYTNFETRGAEGIFFVPDEPQYALVLRASAASSGAFGAYLLIFSRTWLWKH